MVNLFGHLYVVVFLSLTQELLFRDIADLCEFRKTLKKSCGQTSIISAKFLTSLQRYLYKRPWQLRIRSWPVGQHGGISKAILRANTCRPPTYCGEVFLWLILSPLPSQLCNYQALIIMQLSMLVKGCQIIDFQSMLEKQRQFVLHVHLSAYTPYGL